MTSTPRTTALARVYDAQHRLALLVGLDEASGQAQLRLQEGPDAGIDIYVPATLLRITGDDTYALPLDLDDKLHEDSVVAADDAGGATEAGAESAMHMPLHEESLYVGKTRRRTGRGVRIVKTVSHHVQHVDEPLQQDRFTIEHVPRAEFVEYAPAPRQEGDTWIFPVVEEVLVVQKRLRVTEEIRVTRRQETTHAPQDVTLRKESITTQPFETSAAATSATASAAFSSTLSDSASSASPTDPAARTRNRSP